MKLVLFSPFTTHSAIGRVTALIVRALLELGHSAVVVRTEKESLLQSATHDCEADVIPWTDSNAVNTAIKDADALVYQIGNSYSYHRGGLNWLAIRPGIVCLHDFLIAHLFIEWAQDRHGQAERVLTGWYGEGAAADFFAAESPRTFIDMASRLYPMTEWICSMARGVVSHSHWGMIRVAQSCPGPVRVLPLPYDAPLCATLSVAPKVKDGFIDILTVGHVNPNKRIDSVIRAIGSSALLRATVRYRLCGSIEPSAVTELAALARTHGVSLEISGETDSLALQNALNEADIVCCLRWPSFEAASATAIEGMLYGKAVVVINSAFYSELPDDCVQKISLTDEVAELKVALEYLCKNPQERHAMAARAQQWAIKTFDAASYAENLIDLSTLTAAAAPAIDMVDTLAALLLGWHASAEIVSARDLVQPLELFNAG